MTSPAPSISSSADYVHVHGEDPHEQRRLEHHEADVLVVGAGIFGTAISIALAEQGRSVILLEKSLKQPDRIVGELLQPGGVSALEKLGLRDCLDDIDAVKVNGYDVIYYGSPVKIPYPADPDDLQKKRPEGRSFHHGRLIQRLREKAMRTKNISVFESTAVKLVKSGMTGQVVGVEAKTNGISDYFFANLTIVSDGYASTFRADMSTTARTPTSKSKFFALELIDCPLPSPSHGHVILGAGAPVLLYQIGTHETRALIDVPTGTPTASVANGGIKGHLRKQVLPSLPPQVQPSFSAALSLAEHPSTDQPTTGPPPLRSMPNSYLAASTNTTPGLALFGDALNMRHPLTGGGMTVAFNDVVLLRDLLSPSAIGPHCASAPAILAALRTFHWRRKHLTGVINILAQALYSLFAADDPALKALQLGCFRYFQRGGNCVDGPVGLLAGIVRAPLVLVYHFFAVALLSIWIFVVEGPAGLQDALGSDDATAFALDRSTEKSASAPTDSLPRAKPQPSPLALRNVAAMPYRLLLSAGVFWKACVVIFPYIFAELQS